jgi:hypothetical protein
MWEQGGIDGLSVVPHRTNRPLQIDRIHSTIAAVISVMPLVRYR